MKPAEAPLVTFPREDVKAIVESVTPEILASLSDLTDLKADTQSPKMKKMADWAKTYGCASVCVNPVEAMDVLPGLLRGTGVTECYVIDFPLGKSPPEVKACQARDTVEMSRRVRGEGPGNVELDMVINVGRFKRDPGYTRDEIRAVVEAADGEHVKVIIRTSELLEDEIRRACEIVRESGAHFVKNSTGMDAFGAYPEHLRIMREAVGDDFGVKAAGGISNALEAVRLMYAAAGTAELRRADRFRIGTSSLLSLISSMSWLRYETDAWLDAPVRPCTVCPHNYTSKQRREVREVYMSRCRTCPYREYRIHKDF
jgi:deoxyribose-phosphate aldolase